VARSGSLFSLFSPKFQAGLVFVGVFRLPRTSLFAVFSPPVIFPLPFFLTIPFWYKLFPILPSGYEIPPFPPFLSGLIPFGRLLSEFMTVPASPRGRPVLPGFLFLARSLPVRPSLFGGTQGKAVRRRPVCTRLFSCPFGFSV